MAYFMTSSPDVKIDKTNRAAGMPMDGGKGAEAWASHKSGAARMHGVGTKIIGDIEKAPKGQGGKA